MVTSAPTRDGRITGVRARCDKTEHLYDITAKLYLDCTGDSRLGLEAGAEMRYGREARAEFSESLAPETPDQETLGSSILFTSRKYDKPMPFTPPKWARKVTSKQLVTRSVASWEYGYWWIEWGGQLNTIRDNERIRFELLAIVMGVWDHIKNSGRIPQARELGDGLGRHGPGQAREPAAGRRPHAHAVRPDGSDRRLRGRGGDRRLADGRPSARRLRSTPTCRPRCRSRRPRSTTSRSARSTARTSPT